MKRLLKIFNLYELIFITISLLLLIGLGIYNLIFNFSVLNIFELISVILGLLAATLNGKRKKYAFFFYSVYVTIYGIISFISKQYGEGVLNIAINLPMYLYTIYNYYIKDKRSDKNIESSQKDFKINKINKYMIIGTILFIPIITGLYGFILSLLKSNYPYLNALATSLALVSVFLATKGILEQWYFWIFYSIILIVIWVLNYINSGSSGLLYIALNIIYVIVNTYFLIKWYIIYKKQNI
ncbi:MAG: nicotinamide mononucleotide transporter [Firmicutes bacterium]|uniref:Nicotinamide mononucleotide transporter n=1 Tax=Candidatus Onthovivens merdipullorum TaxID=2840889 RepID=A0A9D9DHS8_9BACL|nr:nicotinamide mononucleotide transporter [Candidatus Onthovivens merdipullorum]